MEQFWSALRAAGPCQLDSPASGALPAVGRGETLSARGVALQFLADGEEHELRLSIEIRRQVFLIFKESLNNIARHARATCVKVALRVDQSCLMLEVEDDGCGFYSGSRGGHGLRNMAGRARALGGTLEVTSRPGSGTRLVLRLELGRPSLWRWRLTASA